MDAFPVTHITARDPLAHEFVLQSASAPSLFPAARSNKRGLVEQQRTPILRGFISGVFPHQSKPHLKLVLSLLQARFHE